MDTGKIKTTCRKRSAANTMKKDLRASVLASPSYYWAERLKRKIADPDIRNWAASIIWWAYPGDKTPMPGQALYEMMDDFRFSVLGRDAELKAAFRKIGLPEPEHEITKPRRNAA